MHNNIPSFADLMQQYKNATVEAMNTVWDLGTRQVIPNPPQVPFTHLQKKQKTILTVNFAPSSLIFFK